MAFLAACGGGSGTHEQPQEEATTPAGDAYHTGVYPDLFADLLGEGPAAVQAKIDAAWEKYFGAGTDRLFYPVGADMGYVLDSGNGDIRSEGMSYGMMLAVQLDHRDVFDKLWRFARTYSLYPSGPWQGYLAWQLEATSYARLGTSNASDGEEWTATALFLAAHRWGNDGAFDYQADAQALLDTMLHTADRPLADRTISAGHFVTNMFDAATHQVVFVADESNATFTDPSYHLPHFYELWAAWADKDRAFWCAAAAASRAFLATTAHPTTGLAPDYARFDGTAYGPSWGAAHVNFEYDAFRVGANLGVDHLWFDVDPWQVTEADRLLGFFQAQGAAYPALWTLAGQPLNTGHGAGLTGTNAALALTSSRASLRTAFVRALWDAPAPSGQWRYYDGLLYTLGLLEVSGNFRVYHPPGGAVAACP
jgi:oligosaccharide reducing-end xylanase